MRSRLLPVVALALAAGCSDTAPLPMATSPEEARPAIECAFTAWKDGKTADDLRRQSPPVVLLDDDFARGRRLVDYRIEGDGTPRGTGLRFNVVLTLRDGGRPPVTRKLAYRVVTEPNVSVSREDS
jgi:hypothetical protein